VRAGGPAHVDRLATGPCLRAQRPHHPARDELVQGEDPVHGQVGTHDQHGDLRRGFRQRCQTALSLYECRRVRTIPEPDPFASRYRTLAEARRKGSQRAGRRLGQLVNLIGSADPGSPAARHDGREVITVALAVCLVFDPRTERAIRALWDRLESLGVPSLRSHTHGRHVPHLSYAVLRTWDLAEVTAALAGLEAGEPVELRFDGIGMFRRGRAWLLAGVGSDLALRQERVVAAVTATGADLHKHYVCGTWLPHCSLAPRVPLARLPVLAAGVYDVLPMPARLDRAALIDSATGELWPLPTLP
jgi:hypothetical protein